MSDALFAYVANHYGFSEAGRFFLYEKLIPVVEQAGFVVLNPWELTPPEFVERAKAMPFGEEQRRFWAEEVNPVLTGNNVAAIERSHLLLGCVDDQPDPGVAGEIGFAAGLKKFIEAYRGDFRICSDNIGSDINIQVEKFVQMGGGVVSKTLDELAPRLERRRRELHRLSRGAR